MPDQADADLITLTADIVSSHVANNNVQTTELPTLITSIYEALSTLGQPATAPAEDLKPAVSIRSSVKPDYIICLEDGKKLTMLKRYLMRQFGMTPEQYRQKWNLPADYPMVAPSYAERRRTLAKEIGLGRRPRNETPAPPPARRGRPRKETPVG